MVDRKCDPTGRLYTALEKLAVRNFLFISVTLAASSCFMQERYLKRKHRVAGVRYLRWGRSHCVAGVAFVLRDAKGHAGRVVTCTATRACLPPLSCALPWQPSG